MERLGNKEVVFKWLLKVKHESKPYHKAQSDLIYSFIAVFLGFHTGL